MESIKLQLGSLTILVFITIVYVFRLIHYKRKVNFNFFLIFIVLSFIEIVFDGLTAYSVNNLEKFDHTFNLILHGIFLSSIDAVIFFVFLQVLTMTEMYPTKTINKLLVVAPFILNVILVFSFLPELAFIENNISNYSMGISAYTCYVMVFIYVLATIILIIYRWNQIELRKKISSITCLSILTIVCIVQAIFPYILITSIGVVALVLGLYLNLEDPLFIELYNTQQEMVMGFATLIESRDESTGEHVKRTTGYVKIILNKLKHNKKYSKIISKNFFELTVLAAPLHDIGKIAIPDRILQKNGKLTNEEFDIIKTHTIEGAKIIDETFGHTSNEKYYDIVKNVALYHHEKYNGTGYPQKLKAQEIPLEARIMSVADVFDAVSENRCYRDALPIEKCFEIIKEGRGTAFDPDVVDAFLSSKEEIIKVHNH